MRIIVVWPIKRPGESKTTQALFDKLAAAGTTVRIPVTWMGHIETPPVMK